VSAREIARAVDALRRGGVVAFPTESSFGLAVDALDERALAKLIAVKGRPEGKPPPVLVDGEEMARTLVREIPPRAREWMAAHWPGGLTLVLPARDGLPPSLVEDGCVGVRAPSHPIAAALVRAFGAPLTATSANRSGDPAAQNASEAALPGVDLVLEGRAWGAAPSTVVRVRGDQWEILRRGAIDL